MVCTRVCRCEWRYWSYAQVAGATADASNGPHHPLRSHRIINAGAGRVPPVVDMNDNPGSPILDRDGLSRALAGCGMAVEAMEASEVENLSRVAMRQAATRGTIMLLLAS